MDTTSPTESSSGQIHSPPDSLCSNFCSPTTSFASFSGFKLKPDVTPILPSIEVKSEEEEEDAVEHDEDVLGEQEQLKADKNLVYAHPLFPLLAMLFEKCERATHCIHAFESDASLKSFDSDIVSYIQHHQKTGISLFTDRPEVDSLMIRSIQVFRIHLLELEKVSDLCSDFCARYMNCLRSKMRSEVLLRGVSDEGASSQEETLDISGDCCLLEQLNSESHSSASSINGETIDSRNLNNNNNSALLDAHELSVLFSTTSSSSSASELSISSAASVSGSSGGLMASSPQSKSNSSHNNCSNQTGSVTNSNFNIENLLSFNELKMSPDSVGSASAQFPMNFAELLQAQFLSAGLVPQPPLPTPSHSNLPSSVVAPSTGSTSPLSSLLCSPTDQPAMDLTVRRSNIPISDKMASMSNKRKTNRIKSMEKNRDKSSERSKRGILPKHATAIMRTWLFQHIVHPYPTEDEKRAIAAETKLTLLQVNNWFINARRRILQPMLDSANTLQNELCKNSSQTPPPSIVEVSESKKTKSVHNGSGMNTNDKFWSQSLANILKTSDTNNRKNES